MEWAQVLSNHLRLPQINHLRDPKLHPHASAPPVFLWRRRSRLHARPGAFLTGGLRWYVSSLRLRGVSAKPSGWHREDGLESLLLWHRDLGDDTAVRKNVNRLFSEWQVLQKIQNLRMKVLIMAIIPAKAVSIAWMKQQNSTYYSDLLL